MPGRITKEQLEGMREGCKLTVEELAGIIRDAARRALADLGLVVEYSKAGRGGSEVQVDVFDIEALISTPQVRNGLIRSQRIFRLTIEGQPPAVVNMELMSEHGIDSYYTLEKILYGTR
jgi:hypothetical protein